MDSPKLNKLYLVLGYMKKGDLMKILNGDARRVECDPMCIKDVWHIFRQVTFNGAVLILYAAVAVVDVDIYIYMYVQILSLTRTHIPTSPINSRLYRASHISTFRILSMVTSSLRTSLLMNQIRSRLLILEYRSKKLLGGGG